MFGDRMVYFELAGRFQSVPSPCLGMPFHAVLRLQVFTYEASLCGIVRSVLSCLLWGSGIFKKLSCSSFGTEGTYDELTIYLDGYIGSKIHVRLS